MAGSGQAPGGQLPEGPHEPGGQLLDGPEPGGQEPGGQLLEGPHEQLLAARGGQILTLQICTASSRPIVKAAEEMS